MYMDEKRNRVLLRSGESIVEVDDMVKMILTDKIPNDTYCIASEETELYEEKWGEAIGRDIGDVRPGVVADKQDRKEDIDLLLQRIVSSDRYKEEYIDRLDEEFDFFIRTNNVRFVLKCAELIDRFKEEGVVWGVGRGSCCASLMLYVLEVHDIDPVKFDIPFSELSKEEQKMKWEE